MDRYPQLILTCEGLGIYALGAGKNPMAEVRRLDTGATVGAGPLQLMSIVAHIDLSEWDEVPGNDTAQQQNPWPLTDEDRCRIQQRMSSLLRARRDAVHDRGGDVPEPTRVLGLVFDRSSWESLGLSDRLDQGFRHLTREEQLEMLTPLLARLRSS